MSEIRNSAFGGGGAPASGGFLVGPKLAGAIKSLIDQNEKGVNKTQAVRIETRFEDQFRPQQKVFRVCTFTGSWSKNTDKVVTFKFQTDTPNTVQASNLFAEISVGGTSTATRNCAIAKEGTAWFLIAAEC